MAILCDITFNTCRIEGNEKNTEVSKSIVYQWTEELLFYISSKDQII